VIDLWLSFAYSPAAVGRTAMAAGAAGLAALTFGLLSVAFGRPYGRLYSACVCVAALLSAGLAMLLFPQHWATELAQVAFVLALTGAFLAALGAVAAFTSASSWFLAQLYMASGYGLIGLWLLIFTISGAESMRLPHRVVNMGWFAGVVMSLGLAAVPGLLMRSEDEQTAPWLIRYIGRSGNLGWLILFPLWCIWLGVSRF
jgi:hypothetical protein